MLAVEASRRTPTNLHWVGVRGWGFSGRPRGYVKFVCDFNDFVYIFLDFLNFTFSKFQLTGQPPIGVADLG